MDRNKVFYGFDSFIISRYLNLKLNGKISVLKASCSYLLVAIITESLQMSYLRSKEAH